MKLIEIEHYPIFTLNFTKPDVAELVAAARMHYDSTCRALAAQGGTIYGLNNRLIDRESATASLNWRDVELLCKVLERSMSPLYHDLRRVLSEYRPPAALRRKS